VVLIPSHKDIHHFHPIPQPPFSDGGNCIVAPNPCELQVNDITISVINTDIVKDLCPNIFAKNMEPAKIDLALRALHEQRTYYPLYPPNPETPIEFEQIDKLRISRIPDILITPSDLMQFAKYVDGGAICVNPGPIIKQDTPGTYATINIDPFDARAYRGQPDGICGGELRVA